MRTVAYMHDRIHETFSTDLRATCNTTVNISAARTRSVRGQSPDAWTSKSWQLVCTTISSLNVIPEIHHNFHEL